METLSKLFGGAARVKIMRLFLMNPEDAFDIATVAKRSKVPTASVRKEIRLLCEIGLVKERSFNREEPKKNGKEGEVEKKKLAGFGVDHKFPHLVPLRTLLTEIVMGNDDMSARFRDVGKVQLLIIAGVFLDEPDSRVDILIVGDKLKKPKIEGVLRRLEAEVGKELTYGILDTAEFEYRYGIYDKFVRDVLDYPHRVVVNKLNLF